MMYVVLAVTGMVNADRKFPNEQGLSSLKASWLVPVESSTCKYVSFNVPAAQVDNDIVPLAQGPVEMEYQTSAEACALEPV